jgi:hypothetical protein
LTKYIPLVKGGGDKEMVALNLKNSIKRLLRRL